MGHNSILLYFLKIFKDLHYVWMGGFEGGWKKKEWKIEEKMGGKGVWMRGGGGEKSGGAQPFSL